MSIGDIGIGSGAGIGSSYSVVSKTYTTDFLLSLPNNGYYSLGATFITTKNNTYDFDSVLLNRVSIGLPISLVFVKPQIEYSMGTTFINSCINRVPYDSVINTLWMSWATVLDQSYRNILEASRETSVSKASGSNLDVIGNVYHSRRLVNETDENYRIRLVTITNILLGYGTKSNCESIIDQAIGVSGSVVNTGEPSTVCIEFENDDAMRAAYSIRSTLESIIPIMISAGIAWTLYTPIMDYDVSMACLGTVDCPYTMDILNQCDNYTTLDMDCYNVFSNNKMFGMNILNSKGVNKYFYMNYLSNKTEYFEYNSDSLFASRKLSQYSMISPNKMKNIGDAYFMYLRTLRKNIQNTVRMKSLFEKGMKSRYTSSVVLVVSE